MKSLRSLLARLSKPVTLFVTLITAVAGCRPEPELLVYGNIPEFSLTEASGRTFTRNELNGQVWVADFIFTNCAGTCPSMTERMRRLQDALPTEIHLVSISVDPLRDTPQVLTAYAKNYGADSNRWHFLTGEKEALYKLSIEGFKLGVDDTMGTEAEPIVHSTRLVLVDQAGRIRGFYHALEDPDIERLSVEARSLL